MAEYGMSIESHYSPGASCKISRFFPWPPLCARFLLSSCCRSSIHQCILNPQCFSHSSTASKITKSHSNQRPRRYILPTLPALLRFKKVIRRPFFSNRDIKKRSWLTVLQNATIFISYKNPPIPLIVNQKALPWNVILKRLCIKIYRRLLDGEMPVL